MREVERAACGLCRVALALAVGVFLLLAAALVVLFFSFRKQLRKVDFEEDSDGETRTTGKGSDDESGQGPVAPRA